ncbi:RRQRL motif-containing zinc-binding protein [Streptomyces sp. NPDC093990]|uniref:RRQRL motif-containing zinc-binding protein n=1 Tax=Streptomyces sp. NPDC093990 TaxID=3155306 RepID=UPI003423A6CF
MTRLPRGAQGLPEYDRGACPDHLATRRQLRDLRVSPGGHAPVGILRCARCRYTPHWSCTHRTRAFLYDLALGVPKRTPTLAQEWALDRAMAARQTCPKCLTRYYACLPLRTQGHCDPCELGIEPSPDTVMIPGPAAHRLAA